MSWPDVEAVKLERIKSRRPGLSGANLVGVAPIEGFAGEDVQEALRLLVAREAFARDGTETQRGALELATAAETQEGTDKTRAVHPAGLAAFKPRARGAFCVVKTADQGVASGASEALVAFQSERYDADDAWGPDSVVRVPPGLTGLWRFEASLHCYDALVDSAVQVQIKGAAGVVANEYSQPSSARSLTARAAGEAVLSEGAEVRVTVSYLTSTADTLILPGSGNSRFFGRFLGAP